MCSWASTGRATAGWRRARGRTSPRDRNRHRCRDPALAARARDDQGQPLLGVRVQRRRDPARRRRAAEPDRGRRRDGLLQPLRRLETASDCAASAASATKATPERTRSCNLDSRESPHEPDRKRQLRLRLRQERPDQAPAPPVASGCNHGAPQRLHPLLSTLGTARPLARCRDAPERRTWNCFSGRGVVST
jgi:hypothetical protein